MIYIAARVDQSKIVSHTIIFPFVSVGYSIQSHLSLALHHDHCHDMKVPSNESATLGGVRIEAMLHLGLCLGHGYGESKKRVKGLTETQFSKASSHHPLLG